MTPDAEVDAVLDATVRELRQSVVRLARRLRGQPQEHGVSNLGVSVLARLYRHHAMTPRALADGEHVAPQTLTKVLAVLELRELVVRRGDPSDGRQSLIELTPAGVEVLTSDSARREQWLAGVLRSELTPAERELVRITAGLLDRLADG